MNIKAIHNAYIELNSQEKIIFLEWLEQQIILYNIFLIFIINKEKSEVKKELREYLVNQEKVILDSNSEKIIDQIYLKYQEEIPQIGKIYFKPILDINSKKTQKKQTKKKNQKIQKSKTKKNNKNNKKSQHKSFSKTKGGYLFHLEDKGDQPITGNDLKRVLDLYQENLSTIKYTQFGAPPTQEDLGHPLEGVILGLLLSRGKLDSNLQYHLPGGIFEFIQKVISNPMEWTYYYQLYNGYVNELSKSKNTEINDSVKKLKKLSDPIKLPFRPI